MKIKNKLNEIWKYSKILLIADSIILIAWAMLSPIYLFSKFSKQKKL